MIDRLIAIIFVAFLLVYAATAEAERPTLNVYYVQSPDSLPLIRVTQLNAMIRSEMRTSFKRKIKIRIRGIEEQKVFPYGPTYSLFAHYYRRIYYYDRLQRGNRRKWAAVYAPPVLDATDNHWMVGMANTGCWRKYKGLSMALATVQTHNSLGAERFNHSFFGIMHELGHTLGLNHTQEPTIMNSAVLSLVNNGVSFSEAEKHKGKHCLRAK